jgi:integrase
MKLTSESVARLKLQDGKSERLEFDKDLPGFGIRLRGGGKRTWIVQYRLGTKQRRLTLGSLATIDATEARRRAKSALANVHLGRDPQMQKVETRAQAAVTLGSIVEQYLPRAKRKLKPRSYAEVERHLNVHWKPVSEMALAKMGRADVATRLNAIASHNGPFAANRARAALSALFSWAIGEGIADANPVMGTNKATDEVSRDRVLSDEELRLIWQQAGDGDYGAIVRLLILTGQRREEVGGMLWRELKDDLWTIGSDRTKNGFPHEVPLGSESLAILSHIRKRDERELVFGSRDGPFSGWSKAKAALDGRLKESLGKNAKLKPWRLHDIRRTLATRLNDLGIAPPHIVEAILNHTSGHKAGVAGVYNRASYSKEKRAALALWAEHVKALNAAGSNVVPMLRPDAIVTTAA